MAAGGHVCILTTLSGNPNNTHLDGEHPNRQVLFLDDAIKIPFASDPSNPESVYYIGFSLSSSVLEEMDSYSPTLVHITVPDIVSLDVIAYARKNDLPLMGTFHSNYVDYLDHYGLFWIKPCLIGFFQHQYSFYQALYCPTPFIKGQLGQQDKRFDKCTNIQVWGRGIDLKKFNPEHRSLEFREKYGIESDDVVICFIGRLVYEKRPDIFAYVIRRLVDECKDVSFKALVVGCGPYETELQQLPNTVCTGWLNGQDLATAYASSDIFLFPSALETFGNVTLEAAGSGLPLVVEAGCSGHLVKHEINGFACPEGDEEAFYRGTLELVTNAELRSKYAAASRELSFDFEKRAVMKQMLNNYEMVTKEFYQTYHGSHEERDSVIPSIYEEAFVFGLVERPCALRMFISCFVFLIQSLFCVYMQFGCLFDGVAKALSYIRRSSNNNNSDENEEEDIEKGKSSTKNNLDSPEMAPWKGISCIYRTSQLTFMTILFFLRLQSRIEYGLQKYFQRSGGSMYTAAKRKDTLEEIEMESSTLDLQELKKRRRNMVQGEEIEMASVIKI